jgi:hypothetical protein
MQHHETSISKADAPANMMREALPLSGETKILNPDQTIHAAGVPSSGKLTEPHRRNRPRNTLANRGVRVLGAAFGVAALWFVGEWVRYGSIPLELPLSPAFHSSIGSPPRPILPPEWLLILLGFLVFFSLFMMGCGTQNAIPKEKQKRGRTGTNGSRNK